MGERLDKCQKSLTDYLDTKRNAFSRFYFIERVNWVLGLLRGGTASVADTSAPLWELHMMPSATSPWIGYIPPLHDAVRQLCGDTNRGCSRLFCGNVHKFEWTSLPIWSGTRSSTWRAARFTFFR